MKDYLLSFITIDNIFQFQYLYVIKVTTFTNKENGKQSFLTKLYPVKIMSVFSAYPYLELSILIPVSTKYVETAIMLSCLYIPSVVVLYTVYI